MPIKVFLRRPIIRDGKAGGREDEEEGRNLKFSHFQTGTNLRTSTPITCGVSYGRGGGENCQVNLLDSPRLHKKVRCPNCPYYDTYGRGVPIKRLMMRRPSVRPPDNDGTSSQKNFVPKRLLRINIRRRRRRPSGGPDNHFRAPPSSSFARTQDRVRCRVTLQMSFSGIAAAQSGSPLAVVSGGGCARPCQHH